MAVSEFDDPELTRLRRARSAVVVALAVQVLVLVVTGVYLWFEYRPTGAQAWGVLYRLDDGVTLARRVRSVHRWTSHLTVITSVAAAALVAAEAIAARTPRRPKARVVLGVPLVLTLVVASLSGFILPWDQLALKAVTVGTNMKGYGPIFGDQVRFALVRGAEVDVSTLRMWTVVHVVTAALAVPLLLVLGRRPRRAQQPAPPPPAGPPATPSS